MNKKTIVTIALIAVVSANLVYLVGRFFHPSDLVYTARDRVSGADRSVYISMIEEARQGSFLFHNLFTSEPQSARFVQPFWLFLGMISSLLSLSPIDVFDISRIIAGFFFLLFLGGLCNRLFQKSRWALVAFLLITFSSGIGALIIPPGKHIFLGKTVGLYVDLWQQEMNTFATLMHSSLFIVSQMLILFIFLQWIRWEETRSRTTFFSLIIAVTVIASIHPYDVLVVVATVLVRVLWIANPSTQRRLFFGFLAVASAAALPVIIHLFLIGEEIALAGWFMQNVTTAHPSWYLVGYGLLLPFAVYGMRRARRMELPWQMFFLWCIVALFFLFVPLQFQRRVVNGVHIPLALFATLGLRAWILRYRASPLMLVVSAWVLAIGFFGSTFYLIGGQFLSIFEYMPFAKSADPRVSVHDITPLYISRKTAEAMRWLSTGVSRDAVILAAPLNGNLVPAFSGKRVYAGHGHQTVGARRKFLFLYEQFFMRNDDDRAKQFFFRNEGITHLFWTSLEESISIFRPEEKSYLREVYRNGDARVYEF